MTVHASIDAPDDGALALDRLLRPRSVAIVGASPTPGALGASVLGNLERNGYAGEIHLINPKRDEIGGRPCLKTISDLPPGVDAAVLAIPRVAVLDSVRALAERGVGAAVIFSAGFAEGGEEGLAEQRDIADIARRSGMVIEGPNCLGMVNHIDGVALTFVETETKAPHGPAVGVVSQSGAMAAVLSTTIAARDLPTTFSVSTGNEAASGVEDYVDYLVGHPDTRVIAMIVEQFRKPRRFLAAARAARKAGKTIVLLHPGKSSAARESAATHTGAMAGDYKTMRLLVGREGVIFAETLEELADIAEILIRCPAAEGAGGTVVMGESGAFKALMLDLAEELGLPLPTLDAENAPALRAALPEFVGVSNPLDLTAQGLVDPDLYYRTLAALFEDARVKAVVVGIIQTDPITIAIKSPPILKAVRDLRPTKPVIYAGLDEGAPVAAELIAELRAAGVPYFPSSERVLRALKRILGAEVRTGGSLGEAPPIALPSEGGVVAEYLAKQMLAPAGVRFPVGRLATSAEEAGAIAAEIGFPVVLKAQAADLPHKSDVGGVIVGLADADAVGAGYARMLADIARHRPGLKLDGVLVERMGARGLEMIVGGRNDPEWGPVILAGMGGVTAEMIGDVRLIAPDMTADEIKAELAALQSGPLLSGYRGSPALDVDAFAALIQGVAATLAATPAIAEIDLNPVIVYPQGEGVVALDALIYARPAG